MANLVRPIANSRDIVDVVRHAIAMVQSDPRERYVPRGGIGKPLVIAELELVLDFFDADYESVS